MKKVFVSFTLAALLLVVFLPQEGVCREQVNLFGILKDAKEVNVYVAPVTDSSGEASTMTANIKKHLEDALATRMSINFNVVKDEKDADIVISCDITERIWLENDPVDMVHGVGALAYDLVRNQNYARMKAIFEVKKGPEKILLFKNRGGIFRRRDFLYKEELQATITRSNMPEAASEPLLEERIIEVFMRRCFSRNAKPL